MLPTPTSIKTIRQLAYAESKDRLLVKSKERQSQLGEVFTPTSLVLEMLQKLPKDVWAEGKTFLDPACGNAQFLAVVLIIKMQLGHKNPLSTIYGVDIMADNVQESRERLFDIAGRTKKNFNTLVKNIVCADGLTYDYSFGE